MAARFEITPAAAIKRIQRADWHRNMAPAVALPKHEPAPPPRPNWHQSTAPARALAKHEGKSKQSSVDDANQALIEKHIKKDGPRTIQQFVSELGLDLLTVARLVGDSDRFEPLPGDRYGRR